MLNVFYKQEMYNKKQKQKIVGWGRMYVQKKIKFS